MPRRPLPVPFALDPEDLAAGCSEEVHPDAGVLLDVVDLGAGHLGEQHLAHERHARGSVLDRLHAVGTCHV